MNNPEVRSNLSRLDMYTKCCDRYYVAHGDAHYKAAASLPLVGLLQAATNHNVCHSSPGLLAWMVEIWLLLRYLIVAFCEMSNILFNSLS